MWSPLKPPEDFRSVVAAGATCWPTYKVARRASAESLSQAPAASMPTSTSFTANLEKKLRRSQESTQKRGLSTKGSCRRQWLLKQVDKRKVEENPPKVDCEGPRKENMKKSTFQL